MFIGHYAIALAAKRVAPRTSLGTLCAAAQLADLLWPAFLLTRWETVRIEPGNTAFTPFAFDSYPVSHSLLALLAWGLLFGLLYRARTGYGRGALVIAALVVSHWFLDAATHRADMPLYPGGPRVGLALWNSVPLTLAVEGAMFVAGLWVYVASTRPRDAIGRYGLAALVLVLALAFVAPQFAGPPPSVRAVALGAIIFGWLNVFWAGWVDRHRAAATGSPGQS
jgi:membrane-bound metal-dependent hydrolase YbcI (DUF457 family)